MDESSKQTKSRKHLTLLLILVIVGLPCIVLIVLFYFAIKPALYDNSGEVPPPEGRFAIETPSTGDRAGIDFYVDDVSAQVRPAPASIPKDRRPVVMHPNEPPGDTDMLYRFASLDEIKKLGLPYHKDFKTSYGTTKLGVSLQGDAISIDSSDGISEVHSTYKLEKGIAVFSRTDVKMLNGH